ncbi:MAG: YdcF family protein [Verrucomicrobia bacterium]|nr:YdcF family protein [Verrucomicrobiota bacterium]MDE3098029.1 YdcF family protein [Verrucomicrobiota bacterium]
MNPRSCLLGLLLRKERWGLSARGWLVLLLLLVLAAFTFLAEIHPFLAVTRRVNANILVVEGWLDPYGIDAAVKEFKAGHYARIYTTGCPIEGAALYRDSATNFAQQGADHLKAAGIPVPLIQMVPSTVWNRDRTYYSAIALRDWFLRHHLRIRNFNVLTEDAHARRTWLLFHEAFGPNVRVGIISVPNPDYPPRYWWKYSEGVREIIDETIAYIYAKFFFWPPSPIPNHGNR